MARIRTVKPEHWNDKHLPSITLQAHLLWIGIWNFSDDKGVIENDPFFIKSQIFPRRKDIRLEQVEQWLDQLVQARFLVPFTYNNVGYLVSRTFLAHQKIDKPKPSKVPQEIIREAITLTEQECSGCVVDASTTSRAVEYSNSTVEEGKGEYILSPTAQKEKTEEDTIYEKFNEWLKINAPSVLKLPEPLTKDELTKLKDSYPREIIYSMFIKMDNYKPLLKKNKSAYRTFLNWTSRESK